MFYLLDEFLFASIHHNRGLPGRATCVVHRHKFLLDKSPAKLWAQVYESKTTSSQSRIQRGAGNHQPQGWLHGLHISRTWCQLVSFAYITVCATYKHPATAMYDYSVRWVAPGTMLFLFDLALSSDPWAEHKLVKRHPIAPFM